MKVLCLMWIVVVFIVIYLSTQITYSVSVIGMKTVIEVTRAFQQPPCGEFFTVFVTSTELILKGTVIFIEGGGHYYVVSVQDEQELVLLNACEFINNAKPGSFANGKVIMGTIATHVGPTDPPHG